MHNTKPSISIIKDSFTRLLMASIFILVLIALMTFIRGVSSDIENPFSSDDWLWISLFLILWNGVPAFLSALISGFTAWGSFKSYIVCITLQLLAFYIFIYKVSSVEGNELSSSPLILLVYISIPLALMYYPVFYFRRNWIFKNSQ